jgi:peptidoglycan/LPS O-acetylase OafA/YrhL
LLKNTSPTHQNLTYRPDIDGLRALAVLLVILFHAFPNWAHGGFIGVDIFFVISGFLITSIILKDLNANSFGFVWFYSKRIIRIFPALILVLLSSILLGWFLLYSVEYQLLGKHIISAVGFFSNFTYLGEAGYFDSRAVEKPLLHLWSLAIEEQFYLIWPLLFWLVNRTKTHLISLILVLWLVSFAFNIYEAYHYPVWDYYSPQSRFWELLTGAFLACWMISRMSDSNILTRKHSITANAISIFGLICLVVGAIVTYAHSRFPGWLALLPVVGASCIIFAGPQAYINRFFLSNQVMVGLGLISYPLYLWHWVLLSFAQIWGPIFIEQKILLLLVSLLLSCLTYFYVEKPLRAHFSVQKKALILAFCMAVILGIGCLLNQNGFEQRQVNQINAYEASAQDGADGEYLEQGCGLSDLSLGNFFYGCLQDKRGGVKFAIIGDSHAMSLFPGLVRTSTKSNRWLAIYGPGGPQNFRPYLSNTRDNVSAKDSVYTDQAVEQISQNPQIQAVLLTFSSNSLLPSMANASMQDQQEAYRGFDSIITELIRSNKKVVLLIDNPHLAQPQDCYHRQVGIAAMDQFGKINPECIISIEKFEAIQEKYRKVLHNLSVAHPGEAFVFDATPYLCSAEEGVCSYKKNGRRMYAYSDHLSDYAAGKVGEPLNQYLRSIKSVK